MSNNLRTMLWAMRGNSQDKVFNITIPALRYSFEKLLKKLGFFGTHSIHSLRHSCASLYLQGGGNITDLKRILGHAKIELTMSYSHFSQQYLRQAIKVMDSVVALPEHQNQQLEQK